MILPDDQKKEIRLLEQENNSKTKEKQKNEKNQNTKQWIVHGHII